MPAMLAAQCGPVSLPVPAFAGGYSQGSAVWDPDGPGPAGPRLVVSTFVSHTSLLQRRIRSVDLTTGIWSVVPGTIHGRVYAMAGLTNGRLIAAGQFEGVDQVPTANIAMWDGTVWQSLGTGIAGVVQSLAVLPNGDLVAAGAFDSAGDTAVANVARWDGTTWHSLGAGVDTQVNALLLGPNGDLFAGGWFTSAGGVAARGLARWDGSAWHAVAPGLSAVLALALDNQGVLHATEFSSVFRVASGTTTTLATFSGDVTGITFADNGDLLVGGFFTHLYGQGHGIDTPGLARRTGQTWARMPGHLTDFHGFQRAPDGDIAVLGFFHDQSDNGLRRWDGTRWGVFGRGLDGAVTRILEEPNGDAILCGSFRFVDGIEAGGLARWNGHSFAAIGGGTDGTVAALARASNGDLLAGGRFMSIGGVAARHVARWNSTTWSPLPGLGPNDEVATLLTRANGDIVAGGTFWNSMTTRYGCARWNGSTWAPFGTTDWEVTDLAQRSNGELVAIGRTYFPVARQLRSWNGSGWTLLGTGAARALPLANGDLVVSGAFTPTTGGPTHRVARWNGTTWSAVGDPPLEFIYSLGELPNGDLLAGGWSLVDGSSPRACRWDGANWTPYGAGIESIVLALSVRADGIVRLGTTGGSFEAIGGPLLEFAPGCPSSALAYGAGCAGTGGTNVLAVENLPWLGGTFTASSTGFPANALVLAAYGSQPLQLPLTLVSPFALPGCDGLVLPDWADVLVPAAGIARSLLPVPTSSALIGATFFHQHVPLELDALGNVALVTSTNALQLRIGAL